MSIYTWKPLGILTDNYLLIGLPLICLMSVWIPHTSHASCLLDLLLVSVYSCLGWWLLLLTSFASWSKIQSQASRSNSTHVFMYRTDLDSEGELHVKPFFSSCHPHFTLIAWSSQFFCQNRTGGSLHEAIKTLRKEVDEQNTMINSSLEFQREIDLKVWLVSHTSFIIWFQRPLGLTSISL